MTLCAQNVIKNFRFQEKESKLMSIVATLLKNKAPQAAWLVSVKDLASGETRYAAHTSLGAAKKTAVLFANSLGDLNRTRLPWAQDESQKEEGIQYFRAEVDS